MIKVPEHKQDALDF